MNANLGIKMNNNYHIELIDSTTGKVKQSGDFHNMAISNFVVLLGFGGNTSSSPSGDSYGMLNSLQVGSGTTPPAKTDTSLASLLWRVTGGTQARNMAYEWVDDYTLRAQQQFTFPATSSFVGTITELGLVCNGRSSYDSQLVTRALLTDSEGQQISFVKTDTDILIIRVTAEVSISSSDDSFHIFKRPKLLRWLVVGNYTDLTYPSMSEMLGDTCLLRFDQDTKDYYRLADAAITSGLSSRTLSRASSSTSLARSKVRLGATQVTTERYFKYLALSQFGYWDLTDPDVFPIYDITGISVGTGDGSTDTFTCPLSYFKEGTDKVYKNGIQLTRGVDYTLSSHPNTNCLPEVTQASRIIANIQSDVDTAMYPSYAQGKPLFKPAVGALYTPATFPDGEAYGFNSTKPLFIEYTEAVPMNCLVSTGLRYAYTNSSPQSMTSGVTLSVDYSDDGEYYTEAGTVSLTPSTGACQLDFETKTAKYWRIRTNLAPQSTDRVIMQSDLNTYITLNYKDPGIKFTTPPADGDVITMDVSMDRIMKNENFVVDVEWQLNFTY